MIGLAPGEYRQLLLLGGLCLLLAAWAPSYTRGRPLSLPMLLVGAGAALFAVPGMPSVDPRRQLAATEHLTELGVIVALLGAGLKLDRPIGVRRWATTWRLLGIAMPLTIAFAGLIGWKVVGLAPAAALLLGAALAPTDPVLAAEVQVGEPSVEGTPDAEAEPGRERHGNAQQNEDEVRFSLTSEAGLNDGLAFPFVWAAIALAEAGPGTAWMGAWLLEDVIGRVLIGTTVGFVVGWLLGRAAFDPPGRLGALADAQDGFVALAATLLAYSAAELLNGYGFLAVFIAAVSLRNSERGHSYHRVLHDFSGQIEQIVVTVLLILLGGAVTSGVLAGLTWRGAMFAATLIFLVRPLCGAVALRPGWHGTARERRAIGFFGIRGVGSIYYVAFATRLTSFDDLAELWATVVFTVLLSIVLHGVTASPIMEHLDRRRRRNAVSGGAGDDRE